MVTNILQPTNALPSERQNMTSAAERLYVIVICPVVVVGVGGVMTFGLHALEKTTSARTTTVRTMLRMAASSREDDEVDGMTLERTSAKNDDTVS
jgi:hypothetical protein